MAYKIMIAEDDTGLNEGIRPALKQNDIVFVPAYSIREAKELLNKEHPDMVLLDIQFPDGSGDDYITKPFSLMALRTRVENVRKRTTNAGAWIYEQTDIGLCFLK